MSLCCHNGGETALLTSDDYREESQADTSDLVKSDRLKSSQRKWGSQECEHREFSLRFQIALCVQCHSITAPHFLVSPTMSAATVLVHLSWGVNESFQSSICSFLLLFSFSCFTCLYPFVGGRVTLFFIKFVLKRWFFPPPLPLGMIFFKSKTKNCLLRVLSEFNWHTVHSLERLHKQAIKITCSWRWGEEAIASPKVKSSVNSKLFHLLIVPS